MVHYGLKMSLDSPRNRVVATAIALTSIDASVAISDTAQ
jgi:hypothetical protein